MSTFTSPLQSGTVKDGSGKNLGQALLTQTVSIGFADTTKDLFTLPAESQIVDFYVDVTTVFNAATTNLLDIGKAGALTHFADNLALGALARVLGSSDVSQLGNYVDVGATDVVVQGTYAQSGTAATTGVAWITVVYAVNKVLPA